MKQAECRTVRRDELGQSLTSGSERESGTRLARPSRRGRVGQRWPRFSEAARSLRLGIPIVLGLLWYGPAMARGAEAWREALSTMPFPAEAAVTRSNCMRLFLEAFQSNATVKALIFLPGVADDFYLLNRDLQPLDLHASNLAEAVAALTQKTHVRATFRRPMLLLHLQRERLTPQEAVFGRAIAKRLQTQSHWPHLLLVDRHWDYLQPQLSQKLALPVWPQVEAQDSWHFGRAYAAGWNLSDYEVLRALALATGTRYTISTDRIRFQERAVR